MQPHINKETINSTPIIEPSDLVLEKYYKIATPIYQKIINNAKQNQELIELRDFILPLLMNGQVRVN
jgi:type I restriction enzyme S subunit